MTQTCHFGMALVKELDKVLSGKVISGTGGSFCRNLDREKQKGNVSKESSLSITKHSLTSIVKGIARNIVDLQKIIIFNCETRNLI